jgi:hypothetical protein
MPGQGEIRVSLGFGQLHDEKWMRMDAVFR